MDTPATGILLIADPFLKDPHFARSVVLLCEHQTEGSFGFVINKLFDQTLDELVPESTQKKIPLYFGGPVKLDTVHFLHQFPDLITDAVEIVPGIYWGGNFETAIQLINDDIIDPSKIKFFIGYSGWGSGQLDEELLQKSWLLTEATTRLVFKTGDQHIWRMCLETLGKDFALMANFPIDPTLN